jgi:hypothetical protein
MKIHLVPVAPLKPAPNIAVEPAGDRDVVTPANKKTEFSQLESEFTDMVRSISLAAVSAIALAGAASAEGDFTLGGGYTFLEVDEINLGAVNFQAAYHFSEYFAVEGEALLGVSDDSIGAIDVELDYALAAFVKGTLPLNEQFALTGRVGYSTAELSASAGGFGASGDDQAFAYGAGAQYFFDDRNGVRFDYTRYDFDDGAETDAFGLSYVRRFGG